MNAKTINKPADKIKKLVLTNPGSDFKSFFACSSAEYFMRLPAKPKAPRPPSEDIAVRIDHSPINSNPS